MSIANKIFQWLTKSSAKNATNPNPKAAASVPNNTASGYVEPIEYNTDENIIMGSGINIGHQDTASRGPNNEMLISHKTISVICGCGHIVSQIHGEAEQGKMPKRGIAGKCLYCESHYDKLLSKGKITIMEAERRSLVCSECARIASGVLCCPKHYTAVADANGQVVYLGPETIEDQKRKQIISNIVSPFVALLAEPDQPQLPLPENNND